MEFEQICKIVGQLYLQLYQVQLQLQESQKELDKLKKPVTEEENKDVVG